MEELELTYLAKELPAAVLASPAKEIVDIYLPSAANHPVLRVRKSGSKFEITKKEPVSEEDKSRMIENTIPLTADEYAELSQLEGKRISKIRYYYEEGGTTYEFDVFQEGLKGLVLVDVEFKSVEEKDSFSMPGFCLKEITQEKFIAGGMICGKNYSDIEEKLNSFGYKKLA